MVNRQYRQQIQQQQQDPNTAPATTTEPPADDDPPADPPATPDPPADPPRGGKVIAIPTSQMAKLKRDERDKGKRAAAQAADAQARELGYASHADMIDKLKAKKNRPPASARPTQTSANDDGDGDEPPTPPAAGARRQTRVERELERAREQRKAANRARTAAEKKARQLERQREADRAEHELRLAAVGAGVQDVDYALALCQRQLSGMSDEELAKFDEVKFFKEELRRLKPYLYETVEQPVTTSPPPSDPKPPTPPGRPPAPPPDKDIRTVSRQEYKARLAKLGITDPSVGAPG